MMVRFSEQSRETHCIRNKPIGEGYKLFDLSTTTDFVAMFTPNGRIAAKSQQQEYKTLHRGGKIESIILHEVSIISNICHKIKIMTTIIKTNKAETVRKEGGHKNG
eukprot:13540252-Ditylum_brightwellii.AAC.1